MSMQSVQFLQQVKLPEDFENLLNTYFGDLKLNENLPAITYKAEPASQIKNQG